MALVKILGFCDALGVKEGTVRSKISRGQLVCNEKKLIDTEDPINYIYVLEINGGDQSVFEKHCINNIANVKQKNFPATKKEIKVSVIKKTVPKAVKKTEVIAKKSVLEKPSKIKASVKVASTVEPKIKEPKLSPEEILERDLSKQQNQTMLEINIKKKQADLELIEYSAELKKRQLEKMMGNTLPLTLAMNIISINDKAIFKSLHSQIKNMTSTIVQTLGGTKDDYNSIMIEIEQHLNNARDAAKEKAQMDIDMLVDEYSDTRSRGERKS